MENNVLSQRQIFLQEIDIFLEKLDEIDKNTSYKSLEPDWWLDLSNLQRNLIKIKNKNN
jgi:hypothetical protein